MQTTAEKDAVLVRMFHSAASARSMALTFRSSVACAIEMYDGKIISGFNTESYGQKHGDHAEMMAISLALHEGYCGTDFRRIVELFKDDGHDSQQAFPACPDCWARMWDFTHPYFQILVMDLSGKVSYSTRLKEIFNLPAGQIFPNVKTRLAKPRRNFIAKLPLADELKPFYEKDPDFRDYYDKILRREPSDV